MIKFIVFTFLLGYSRMMTAQDSLSQLSDSKKWIYAEAGGSSVLVGISYDMRLKGHRGLGFRAGLGGVSSFLISGTSSEDDLLTIPMEVNYLVGDKRHFFVAGMCLLPIIAGEGYRGDGTFIKINKGLNLAGLTTTFGYRYAPIKVGPAFQVAWTPIASFSGGFMPLWFSLGAGFSFK